MPTNDSRMVPGSTKEMEVCTICGALLIVNDAQQRVDEHMQGKQHVGYTMIRQYVASHDEVCVLAADWLMSINQALKHIVSSVVYTSYMYTLYRYL